MVAMQIVRSTDGVPIAFWKIGQGPNLVLVHGASADHTRWPLILPRLQERFTVILMDRRGRGGSGDSSRYSVDLEFDDVAAVCDSLEVPVYLLGHSFGGICALGAAQRSARVSKLILYDPSVDVGLPSAVIATLRKMERMLQEDDREGIMAALYLEIVGVSEADLEAVRAEPDWQDRLRSAHTIVRELSATIPSPQQFRDLAVPTLVLAGEHSPQVDFDSARAIHEALPDSEFRVLPGHGHVAMRTAPDLLVDEIFRFLPA
jgi:pimeloyl-ACP methyl ester carboxylesterase